MAKNSLRTLLNKTIWLILPVLLLSACTTGDTTLGSSPKDKSFFTQTPPVASAAQSASPILNPCQKLIPGTPLGLSCLHCSHPKAQVQAVQIAETLRDSCRENIAMTLLFDGSFGFSRDFIGELVRISSEYGARMHLYIYLANGPWQRRSSGLPHRGFASGISPQNFRKEIFRNSQLRDSYRSLIKNAEPLISYTNSINGVVYIIPMLEDNLNYSAAREMESLVKQTILPSLPFALGRNPCPGCFAGNDNSRAPGTFLDQHIGSPSGRVNTVDGLVSNDGETFSYPWEPDQSHLTLSNLNRLIGEAKSKNSTYVIWKAEYQGLSATGTLNDPDMRTYAPITPEARQILLDILSTP